MEIRTQILVLSGRQVNRCDREQLRAASNEGYSVLRSV